MTHFIDPQIINRQRQVILGTILGGSSIVKPKNSKNCYLSMRDKRNKWLEYKADIISSLASKEPFTIEKTYRWHSCCYPIFNEFRDLFYKKDKRHIDPEIISSLTDFGFSIWYGDKGKYDGTNIYLNTHVWGKNGSEAITVFFGYLNWGCEIIKERNNFRIKLDEKSSTEFVKLVSPLLPIWFEESK